MAPGGSTYLDTQRGASLKDDRLHSQKGPGMEGSAGHPEHPRNFIDCVRTRKEPAASAEVAHLSCALSHLGEVAYRVERVLHFDPKAETVRATPRRTP